MNPLNYLYEAVGWVFTHIYDVLKPAFGPTSGWTWALSIIILVVLMRLVMVPLFIKQMHTTRAMSSLQPQMAALRKKYKNDKQTLNQETMKLYQEAGVNPLMGCLPFVLQLPLFFSLFSVLRAIAEWVPGTTPKYHLPLSLVVAGQHAKILGASIADKVLFTGTAHVPLHAKLVIIAAVAVSMATTFLTIRQSMKRGMMPAATPDNPMAGSQKYMTYIMPFFALTGLYWPFGLVLYWVTTNVWTLGQQWILGLRYPYTPPAPVDAAGAPAPAAARSLTGGAAKAGPAKAGPARAGSAKSVTSSQGNQANGTQQSRTQQSRTQQGAKVSRPAANGASSNGASTTAGGVLKRLGRARTEPEPQPELPEVKLVRHQTQRQSRSKRSGKH
ncbi:MAG TPA: membrane protein insertase YidC [Streptosporangiaceae bacterium]|nr:membrane protein insertase YidC [Streptosporangiaceae bacterium]